MEKANTWPEPISGRNERQPGARVAAIKPARRHLVLNLFVAAATFIAIEFLHRGCRWSLGVPYRFLRWHWSAGP